MKQTPGCNYCDNLRNRGIEDPCSNCHAKARETAQQAAFAALIPGTHLHLHAYGRAIFAQVVKKNRKTFDVDGLRATPDGHVIDTSIAYHYRAVPREIILEETIT